MVNFQRQNQNQGWVIETDTWVSANATVSKKVSCWLKSIINSFFSFSVLPQNLLYRGKIFAHVKHECRIIPMEGTSGIIQAPAHSKISTELGQHCLKLCQVGSWLDYLLFCG